MYVVPLLGGLNSLKKQLLKEVYDKNMFNIFVLTCFLNYKRTNKHRYQKKKYEGIFEVLINHSLDGVRGKFFCSAESEYSAQCSLVMSVLQMDIFVFELANEVYILAFLNQIECFHKLQSNPISWICFWRKKYCTEAKIL